MQRATERARQCIDVTKALGAGAKTFRCQRRQRTEGVEPLDTELAGQRAGLAMAGFGMCAQFAHVAEHQPAAARQRGQHLERGAQRTRVGVVGVVDQPGAIGQRLELQAALDRAHLRQARGHLRQRRTGGQGRGRGGQRVVHVVATGQRQRHRHAAGRGLQREAGAEPITANIEPQLECAHFGLRGETKAHHAGRRHAAPQCAVLVIGVDDGDAVRLQPGDGLAFGARHALEAAKALEVFGAGVGDQGDAGTGNGHQFGHFAGMVGAHFDDGAAIGVAQPQQRQRHAEPVVVVAARGQAGAALRQHRGQHFLGGGLAVAAGDADHRTGERRAPGTAGGDQRGLDIGHHDLRQRRIDLTADDGAGGAGSRGRGDEFMAIGARAGQRQEQIARHHLARIDDRLGERRVGAHQAPGAGSGESGERALHAALRTRSAACTCAISLKARRSEPMSW